MIGSEIQLPEIRTLMGAESGPTLVVMGGVHGDELEGVLAARRIARMIDAKHLRGAVRFVAPSHPAAWHAKSRNSPLDGLNLARVFPGADNGRPTEKVAAFITAEAIAGADLLIDLHSAGEGFDMPLMVGFHDSKDELGMRAASAAQAFGAPYLWKHPELSLGRTLSAAATLGVPSIYVEGRGGGQVRLFDLDCYVDGIFRVMRSLGMVDDAPAGQSSLVVKGDGNTDKGIECPVTGYLVTAVHVGDELSAGDLIAKIIDEEGDTLCKLLAPEPGIVMLLRRRSRVSAGETGAIIAQLETISTQRGIEVNRNG